MEFNIGNRKFVISEDIISGNYRATVSENGKDLFSGGISWDIASDLKNPKVMANLSYEGAKKAIKESIKTRVEALIEAGEL
ncbi:hypothetical protein [Leptospira bandrabouensis]|uniref:hypothetical protein n=1 Tax=Leptospira bandrabouensis TaxID=2484903 RepID=UPI0010915AAC|nr:hypothetical protein [Leptospira bandrabouensis]TGN03622.1 hypothetical protein EHR07_17465 [Leptospira bandrabouensis]